MKLFVQLQGITLLVTARVIHDHHSCKSEGFNQHITVITL